MIAVMGAAGHVGSKVTDRLLRANENVRVLQHKRNLDALREHGAEVVTGNALDVGALETLFAGADAALVLLPENLADAEFVANRSKMSQTIVRALRAARVSHVVALSAVPAGRTDAVGPPAGLHELEERLAGLELANVLVLRSAFYMDYLLANLPMIQSQKINGSAIEGDRGFPMIATQDVAQVAAEHLMRRDFAGHRVKLLLGPEDVSMREATAAIGALLGMANLPYVQLPPSDLRSALLGAGMSDEAASLLVEMQVSIGDGRAFGGVRRTAESTTPTRLEEFLRNALSSVEVRSPGEGGMR